MTASFKLPGAYTGMNMGWPGMAETGGYTTGVPDSAEGPTLGCGPAGVVGPWVTKVGAAIWCLSAEWTYW